MTHKKLTLVVGCLLAVASVAACSDDSGGACVANGTQTCQCPGNLSGVQTCNAAGTAWSQCICTGTDSSVPDQGTDTPPPLPDSGIDQSKPPLPDTGRSWISS